MNARILALGVASLLAASPLFAATDMWDGGGGDNNISTNFNWADNTAPVSDLANTDLIFAGTTRPQPNFSSPFSTRSISFDFISPGTFTLGGSAITIGVNGIYNNTANTQTFTNPVIVGSATTSFGSGLGGALAFNNTVDVGTNALSVLGTYGTSFKNFAGTGSVIKSGGAAMTWAPTATTSADIVVNAGTLSTVADGSTDILNGSASIAVNGTSTLNIAENMVLDGGAQLTRAGGGIVQFDFGSSKTLTIQNGSDFIVTGNYQPDFYHAGRSITVKGTGSTMQAIGGGRIDLYANFTGGPLAVQDGGSVSADAGLSTKADGSLQTVTVDGIGSSLSAGGTSTLFAGSHIFFSNNATANFGALELGGGNSDTMQVEVLTGADVIHSGNLQFLASPRAEISYLTVDGAGSTWTQTGTSAIIFGDSSESLVVLNVQNGGGFTSGSGNVTLNATASINIEGGTVNLRGPLVRNGGALNFTRGSLSIVDDFTVGTGGLLGLNYTVDALHHFATAATTTIDAFRTLTIDGGTFSTGALVNNGTLAFNKGTLGITGAAGFNIGNGALGANVSLGAGKTLQVTNTTTVAGGASLILTGGATSGGALANGGLITGYGTIGMALVNGSGGQVRAAADGRLVFTGAAGNSGTGHIEVSAGGDLQFQSTLANASAIDVIGGTFRTEGAATNAASTGRITGRDAILRFNGGLTNSGSLAFSFGTSDVFGDIANSATTGRIVISGNSNVTFYDDLVNSGTVQVSTGSTAVYFGAVSGAGSFPGGGTNFFEGDLAPGASPALVTFGGDVVYGTFATIQMELGGTARGTGYDAINVAGMVGFNGTLNVPLIGGFQPQAGQVFNLFDWGTKAGTFSTVNLPALSPGLTWSQAALYTAGEIAVGLDAAFTGRVWDGGGADNAWATDNNWDLNVEPLNNGTAALVFAGTTRLAPSVNAAWNVTSITFDTTAGAFTITGPQGITVGAGGIVNNDADTQTIAAAVTLGASQSFTAAAGDLVLDSIDIGAHTLTLAGASDIEIGEATGTGAIVKEDFGSLTVTGALGTGGIAFTANGGGTTFTTSQTLEALVIGDGAVVTLGADIGPAPAFAAPVPEPGVFGLMAMGALDILARRRMRTQ